MKGGKKVYLKKPQVSARKKTMRAVKQVRGRGGYWQDAKNWSKKNLRPFERGLGAVGEAIGNSLGIPQLSAMGAKLGKWVGEVTGLGDYDIKKNTMMGLNTSGTNAGAPLSIKNLSEDRVVVRSREYLGDFFSTEEDFKLTAFDINPGDEKTFPWLSALARNFQEWIPHGMILEFQSYSADALNSTNTALGSVTIASNYNATEPEYQNQQEMLNTQYNTSTKPSRSVLHPIECDPKVNPLGVYYVRRTPLNAVPDAEKWYDICKTQIATVGSQAIANIGKIFIIYEIELLKRAASTLTTGLSLPSARYELKGCEDAVPLGIEAVVGHDNIGLTVDTANNKIIFPAGKPNCAYIVQVLWYPLTTTAAAAMQIPAVTYEEDLGPGDLYKDLAVSAAPGVQLTGTSDLNATYCCVSGPLGLASAQIFGTAGNLPDTTTTVDATLIVTRINPALLSASVWEQFKPANVEKAEEKKMSSFEKRLHAFLEEKRYKHMPIEAQMKIFDRLEQERDEKEDGEPILVVEEDTIAVPGSAKIAESALHANPQLGLKHRPTKVTEAKTKVNA